MSAAERDQSILLGDCRMELNAGIEDERQDVSFRAVPAHEILSTNPSVIVRTLDDDNDISSFEEIVEPDTDVQGERPSVRCERSAPAERGQLRR